MWHLNKINKQVFLYWGKNKPLSYMRFKTVESLSKNNPDWKIKVYYPTQISQKETWTSNEQKQHSSNVKDWFPYLTKCNNVSVESFDMESIGFSNDMSEVHKSDIIRLYLLKENSGVWSDFDIFYTKPLSYAQFNKPINKDKDAFICYHYEFNSVGFLMSAKNSELFARLFEEAKLAKDLSGYQSLGRDLFRTVLDEYGVVCDDEETFEKNSIHNISFETVYPYAWHQTSIIFGEDLSLPIKSIGIHFYAGSEKAAEIEADLEGNIELPIIRLMEGCKFPRIGIGLPLTDNTVIANFMDSFVRMRKGDFKYYRPRFPSQQIDAIRNQLVEQAVADGCSHLLMMDTDQDYPVDTLEKLMLYNKDVVGGLVSRRYPPFDSIAYQGELSKYTRTSDEVIDKEELIEVAAIGCGCILFNMEVFHHIEYPWFKTDVDDEGKVVGEDIGFCAKLKDAGYNIFVDCSLNIGHYGLMRVDRNFYKVYKKLLGDGIIK